MALGLLELAALDVVELAVVAVGIDGVYAGGGTVGYLDSYGLSLSVGSRYAGGVRSCCRPWG